MIELMDLNIKAAIAFALSVIAVSLAVIAAKTAGLIGKGTKSSKLKRGR